MLRRHILEGIVLNARRLEQPGSIVQVLARSSDELVVGVAGVLEWYLPSLRALRAYDEGEIDPIARKSPTWTLTYNEARTVIDQAGAEFPAATIYQGLGGVEICPTVQTKAAKLLDLVVKDHPLNDGNKRSAAALIVHFLGRNDALVDAQGAPRITNNALAAVTLMVAVSDPKEKEPMSALVVSMLADEGR